jgi:hypothetical protein
MKKYKTEFKLDIVKSFLADEGGAKLLARQWSVPEEKIRTWVSHDRRHGIFKELNRRSVAKSRMQAFPVVEDFDVFEAGGLHVGMSGMANFMLKLLNQISVGALPQQFPFQLIEQVMPNSLSLS